MALAIAVMPEAVDVFDGQPDRDISNEAMVIGFTGNALEAAVEDTRSVEEIGRERDRERYEITCLATSWMGSDQNMDEVRNRVYELVGFLASGIAADHTLGGACMRSRLSTVALAQMQSQDGAVATVMFTISVDAFTRRA